MPTATAAPQRDRLPKPGPHPRTPELLQQLLRGLDGLTEPDREETRLRRLETIASTTEALEGLLKVVLEDRTHTFVQARHGQDTPTLYSTLAGASRLTDGRVIQAVRKFERANPELGLRDFGKV